MDINKLLSGLDCDCGRHHECNIKKVYIERNAMLQLTEICKDFTNILIVADGNTFAAAGEKTLAAIADKKHKKVLFSAEELLVPNEAAIEAVTESLGDTELIIGIGSGVIQDLCKYVSAKENIPYLVVATAPSMDGYASNGAAMITDGMKVTYAATLPLAIVADTEVLKNAPIDMLKAGYGDIIGKYSALNDWKLSHAVTGEYFCQAIYDMTYAQIERTLALADGILRRDEIAVKTLMEALITVGILMSFAGSSRPASGSEHHLSHFFEITGIIDNTDYFPHGIDVAFSTVITAALREKILNNKFPTESREISTACREKRIKEIYKGVADGCIALQEKVGNYKTDRHGIYLEKQAEIRSILSEMPSAEAIKEMLSKVRLDIADFYKLYGEEKINNAILFAKDLKDRYTVLWMNYDFYNEDEI